MKKLLAVVLSVCLIMGVCAAAFATDAKPAAKAVEAKKIVVKNDDKGKEFTDFLKQLGSYDETEWKEAWDKNDELDVSEMAYILEVLNWLYDAYEAGELDEETVYALLLLSGLFGDEEDEGWFDFDEDEEFDEEDILALVELLGASDFFGEEGEYDAENLLGLILLLAAIDPFEEAEEEFDLEEIAYVLEIIEALYEAYEAGELDDEDIEAIYELVSAGLEEAEEEEETAEALEEAAEEIAEALEEAEEAA